MDAAGQEITDRQVANNHFHQDNYSFSNGPDLGAAM
jgi:hypothetical protein